MDNEVVRCQERLFTWVSKGKGIQPLRFINQNLPDYVCRLNRSLYGLKQAPRAWFDRLSQGLLHLGIRCGKADSSPFIIHKGHSIILLLIYVDDIIITVNDNKIIGNLMNTLISEFYLNDLGPLIIFWDWKSNTFVMGCLYLNGNTLKIFWSILKWWSALIFPHPWLSSLPLLHLMNDLLVLKQYRQIVGSLKYQTFTRLDIVHFVNKACKHFQAPTESDLRAIKRILRYLKGTIDY